ncbi:hypothetical protein [Streptomyces hydrogenans]|uniref:hypothetical protein n=1 Tax=Streptomyces hydrogenans TaxID=1873719 RepID=UPI0038159F5F
MALIGVAGTVLAALAGLVGVIRAAAINTRGQSNLEDSKSRRAAYGACATALIVRRDAIAALMDGMRSGDVDLSTAKEQLAEARAMRASVMSTIGVVLIEGPEWPAAAAESAAHHLDVWLDGLAYWVGEGMPDRMRDPSQWDGREEDRQLTEAAIERFASRCRRVLHPEEERLQPSAGRLMIPPLRRR